METLLRIKTPARGVRISIVSGNRYSTSTYTYQARSQSVFHCTQELRRRDVSALTGGFDGPPPKKVEFQERKWWHLITKLKHLEHKVLTLLQITL